MRVNPFTSAFEEIGQFFRRSTTSKSQALRDFSIPKFAEDRVVLSDRAIQKLSETETGGRVRQETIVSSSYYFNEIRVPRVVLLDGPASSYQVHRDLEFLRKKKTKLQIADKLSDKPAFLGKQVRSFLKINEKLLNISASVRTLSQRNSYNIKKSKSLDPISVTATTSTKSPVGSFSINIARLAVGQVIVSDLISDTFTGLEASGAIHVNGIEIDIQKSDSLEDIKDKINFGEDYNKNGLLDLGEDINNNGKLEIRQVKSTPFAKGIYIDEDINGDNDIQESEDLNDNEILDGGTSETGVLATISKNRLTLTSISENNNRIELEDHNGVLYDLGFLELDSLNNLVIKEDQLDPDTLENLNVLPVTSSVSVNGDDFEKEVNDISDIIPETTLHLNDASSENVILYISKDLTEAINNIQNFVNVYNDTIRFLNRELAFSKVLEENVTAQKIRNELNNRAEDNVLKSDKNFNNLEKVGIKKKNGSKNSFSQVAIHNLVNNLKKDASNNLSLPPKGSNSIFGGLNKIGIRTLDDDTLTINMNKLKKDLENNSEEVINLFTNASSGIAKKLDSLLSVLNNPLSGTIALQVDKISKLVADSSITSDLAIKNASIQSSQIEKTSEESILLSIRV